MEQAVFSRANPSPRYRALRALYQQLHREGERRLGLTPEQTFPGQSLLPHIHAIKRLVAASGAKTILDYGAGKGSQYAPRPILADGRKVADSIAEYWDVDEVRCFDPGFAPFSALPDETFDGVISTDVLEHCPEEDMAWILQEIFSYARRFVYLNVACFPARKTLPSGDNAHVTLRPPEWWRALVEERARVRPELSWELHASVVSDGGMRNIVARGGPQAPEGLPTVSVDMDGRTAVLYAPNEMTRWRAQTLYTKEPVTIEWLRGMPEGAVFLDVGANVGLYSVFAAICRRARVVAFEPEADNYAALNRNIRLNGLAGRITAYCAGLSDADGLDRLFLGSQDAGGSCHSLGSEVGFDLQPRPASFAQGAIALRLDERVQAGVLPVPAYVKIDVDGFEHRVLQGMASTLRRPELRSLIVELNPSLKEHRAARAALEDLGFRCDAAQVARAARPSGPFKGVAEHVFNR